MKSDQPARSAWWLSGDRHCETCHETFLYEAEVRCIACDSALCAICAIHVYAEGLYFCPKCDPNSATEPVEE